MRVLIFGGTTEGRRLARALSAMGHQVWVSVATPLGAEELAGLEDVSVLVGRRSGGEMDALLSRGFHRCVDATHPYAVQATREIGAACARAGVPLRRLLRPEGGEEGLRVDSPEEAARRIYATTDAHKGALKGLADDKGYEEFVVPDNIGGRYSVLTAVGLLPIAVAGIDIDALMAGAADMMRECALADMNANPAWQYAGARYELYRTGKKIELLAAYEPCFRFMSEWWKQLYGESEGKENKGLFPASVEFTADLHSMGQYIQEGERHLFETVVRFGPSQNENPVPYDEGNGDGLNFLAGKSMDFIRQQAMDGTLLAHVEGGVPNVTLRTGSVSEQTLGGLIYFFEYACGLSGYLLDVNPFDQPGVEAYKKNMFALLGKPGYEDLRQTLLGKLEK